MNTTTKRKGQRSRKVSVNAEARKMSEDDPARVAGRETTCLDDEGNCGHGIPADSWGTDAFGNQVSPEQPETVDYCERALQMLTAGNGMSPEGKTSVVSELITMMAGDISLWPTAYTRYLRKLQERAPGEFAGCAKGLLVSGEFFAAPGTPPLYVLFPRLGEIIRFYLVSDLGLERAEDLVQLEIAVEALMQARLLLRRALESIDDWGAMSKQEADLRQQALVQQKVFVKAMDEIRKRSGTNAMRGESRE